MLLLDRTSMPQEQTGPEPGPWQHAAVRALAGALRPPAPVRPSEWAERNIHLGQAETEHPGPYRTDFKPWLRAVHDAVHDHPDQRGIIIMKGSQVGVTRAMLNVLLCMIANDPGNILYVLDTRTKGEDAASEKFEASLKSNPRLQALFLGQQRRQLIASKKFPGGRLDFVGAGSASGVISNPYRYVFLDELDAAEAKFPSKKVGSLVGVAEGRTKMSGDRARLLMFSHPTEWERGVAARYTTLSDERIWTFDCPHCGGPVAPLWELVSYAASDQEGNPVIDSAQLRCPHEACRGVIDDGQRARATRDRRTHGHEGGSGRFESRLAPEEAARRPYVGLWIPALADGDVPLRRYARGLAACAAEEDRRSFVNMILGEPYQTRRRPMTMEVVRRAIVRETGDITLDVGPGGVRLLAIGVDVQKPREKPVMVIQARAYTAMGHAIVVDLRTVQGFDALAEYAKRLRVRAAERERDAGWIVPSVLTIDASWENSAVLDFSRWDLAHEMLPNHAHRVRILAVKVDDSIPDDNPVRVPPREKLLHPAKPWMGPTDYVYVARHYWVDREMRRWADERITLRVPVIPEDFESHMAANALMPVRRQASWDTPRERWVANARDDWMMAGVYCDLGAAVRCGLDGLAAAALAPGLSAASGEAQAVATGAKGSEGAGWIRGVRGGAWLPG